MLAIQRARNAARIQITCFHHASAYRVSCVALKICKTPRPQMAHTNISISQSKSRKDRWPGMLLVGRLSDWHEWRGRRQEPGGKACNLWLGLAEASLFVKISFHDIAHDRGGKLSMLPALEQRGNHDLGSLSRRETHEPSVVLVRRAVGRSFQ